MSKPVEYTPCPECRCIVRADCLEDVSEFAVFATAACGDCAAELIADDHDSDACLCEYCVRARVLRERRSIARMARACGGFGPLRVVLGELGHEQKGQA